MINPDGAVAGVYRKSHIPDGPGYEEKFYFRPGNTGFKVWPGADTTLGVGICWDQWYPEVARSMMLMGAQILFYPTAIGTEPHDPELDTSRLWRRAMIGHACQQRRPRRRRQPHRHRRRPALLRPQLHLRRARRHPRRVRRDRDRRPRRRTRPRRRQEAPRRLRLLPRPPARALRAAHAGRVSATACSNTASNIAASRRLVFWL